MHANESCSLQLMGTKSEKKTVPSNKMKAATKIISGNVNITDMRISRNLLMGSQNITECSLKLLQLVSHECKCYFFLLMCYLFVKTMILRDKEKQKISP